MRLIDADALVERLEKSHEYHARTSRDEVLLARDIRIIEEQPTIEARPVRHGRWRSKGLAELECTICKYIDVSKRYSNHCPNCGNPMDGGARND